MPTKIEYLDATLIERFWSYVKKSTGCWEWDAGLFSNGYGQFRVGKKKMRAHRVSWQINNGPIPQDKKICHQCDNPKCVRPDHLFLGTSRDNTLDCISKNRASLEKNLKHYYGEEHPNSKLTDTDVLAIRTEHNHGRSKYSLAKRYGIAQSTVGQIVTMRTWRHV